MKGRTAARAVVCTLLAASGGLMITASAQRWWPCRPYDFDAPRCLSRQSDLFDYLAPGSPLIPIGNVAQLEGIGLLLLAAAVLALPSVLASEAPRWLAWGLGVLMSCSVAVLGAVTWSEGGAGRAVADSLWGPMLDIWMLGWPFASCVLFVLLVIDAGLLRWRVAALGLLLCSAPMPAGMLTVAVFGYLPYDGLPWMEAVMGGCVILASGAVWLGASADRMRGRAPSPLGRDLVPDTGGGLA